MQDKNFLVYALLEVWNETKVIRYIGMTSLEPRRRLDQHLREAQGNNGFVGYHYPKSDWWWHCYCRKCEWIRSLYQRDDIHPTEWDLSLGGRAKIWIEPLAWNLSESKARAKEKSYIKSLVASGAWIGNTNLTATVIANRHMSM